MELLLNPFFGFCLFFAISTFFLWKGVHPLFIRYTLLVLFILLLVLSTGWFPRFITQKLESQYPLIHQVNPQIKWIVVLSGGQNNLTGLPMNDRLSSASQKRLIEGVRLFKLLPDATLVLSGGGSSGEEPEATLLAELAHWFVIPQHKIVLEQKSLNTADEARELKSIVHDESFYLVTSAIHMPRSMYLCEQAGLHPIAAPTDFTFFWHTESWAKTVVPNAYNMAYFSIAMHELLGRIWVGLGGSYKS
ncbi:MAG: YdcF family protein [bacterium]|nr:YdcF family protein [bacterium]